MFTGEVDCTYFFTWDTRYACVKEKEDLLCSVTDGKKRYDLSALARHAGRRGPAAARIGRVFPARRWAGPCGRACASATCSREPFGASRVHTFGNPPPSPHPP